MERYFFVHLQKTAGTSLFRRLARHFGTQGMYPNDSDGRPPESTLLVDLLVERWQTRRSEIRMVAGHFPLCTVDLLDAPFTTITVLREPVARTLSYLRHQRQTPADRDKPLEAIYADPLRFRGLVHNHMVKMLSLTPDEMTAGAMTNVSFTPERLQRAKERLTTVDVVGLQERFEDFCAELTTRFGWQLGDAVQLNRSPTEDVPPSLIERIIDDNADDAELFRFAQQLVEERRARTA